MHEISHEYGKPFQHIPPWAPPLWLAGTDDDVTMAEEPHIVRGID